MFTHKKYISIPFSKKKLGKRNRSLSILYNMSELLSTFTDRRSLLSGALERVLEDFNLEAGRIYLMEENGRHLFLAAHSGIETSGLERMNLSEGFSGKAARTKSFIAQYVTDLRDKERRSLLENRGFKIIICVPLMTLNRVIGAMNLASSRSIELDQEKVDLLTQVGNQIAVAAENARLYNELQEKIRHLKQKKEMIKYFAYSMAHDLKSPAIGIHGFSRRLKEKHGGNLSSRETKYCDEIISLASHMVMLLDQMNQYIATKETLFHFECIRLHEIADTIFSEFAVRLEERSIKVSRPASNPEIIGDRAALMRVFRNLVDNALKYGGTKLREIRLDYDQDERFHILSVSDDGTGIEDKDKETIFEAFSRNGTSRGTAGSGLGLAIVKEIAARHGGHAWVENGTAKGVSFNISIARGLNTEGEETGLSEENL
jgi:signal transduction histidine kinase